MAQSEIIIENKNNIENSIVSTSEKTKPAALLLKSYLDKAFQNSFLIKDKTEDLTSKIVLEIYNSKGQNFQNEFKIKSDSNTIHLIAPNEKLLNYAVYTLLEYWGFKKYTAKETIIPELKKVTYPKNTEQIHRPSFEYRVLFYPDCYDDSFRDWHKLDWHINDFGLWGHSFDKLLPPNDFFKSNPKFYALYEGERRGESLCMTNDTVVKLVTKKMQEILTKNPDEQFYSISQNDDVIYCECKECSLLNKKYGGPQGSLYFFLNKIAAKFPKTKITTLAYLHTYKPPANYKIAPNIYTFLCPIELNRSKTLRNDVNEANFRNNLKKWSTTASHLYLWDYTVQFSNYLSLFPNIHTFADNYKFFKENKVKGLFTQGYSDVPGDFTELRQYLLAKLLWNTEIDIEKTTQDFLNGFYGKAAPAIQKYLTLLTQNQLKSNSYLDIYSGPIQSRNSFLSPEAMEQYDNLITEAENAVEANSKYKLRVQKLRLTLEYIYFEQSKFYGKDKHGMFIVNEKGEKEIRKGLTERVLAFSKLCNEFGIYELSEGGLSPDQYYQEWLNITKNTANHLGENTKATFITQPAEDFKGKGNNGITDGIRGYKDFNINWIGWYGTNPEIELQTNKLKFNTIKLNLLEDQRHWIFPPKNIIVYGFKNEKWQIVDQINCEDLTETNTVTTKSWQILNENLSNFDKIKILVKNQETIPVWRKRKSKKPMVMIDEIELYNN